MLLIRGSALGLSVGVALAVATGCGDDSTTEPSAQTAHTVTVTRTVTESDRPARERRAPAFRACDANIRARAGTTTCEFAQNVFYEFWKATDAGNDEDVTAYSPVTERDYDMDCESGATVVCKGDDGSEVRFPIVAVIAYDPSQARDYACSHQVSALDVSGCPDEEGSADLMYRSDGDCDPNYAGACLDPRLSDYDCEGGSGDGPGYTGYVEVVGQDVYDLDRDGDGAACEW